LRLRRRMLRAGGHNANVVVEDTAEPLAGV